MSTGLACGSAIASSVSHAAARTLALESALWAASSSFARVKRPNDARREGVNQRDPSSTRPRLRVRTLEWVDGGDRPGVSATLPCRRQSALGLLLVVECLHVGDILWLPGRALVLDQRVATDDGDLAAFDVETFASRDGLGKGDAVCAINDVDTPRWNAKLEDSIVRRKVLDPYLERREWYSERSECGVHALRVFRVRFHQNVEVLGSARGCPWNATAWPPSTTKRAPAL